jgi:hypothetical protein
MKLNVKLNSRQYGRNKGLFAKVAGLKTNIGG